MCGLSILFEKHGVTRELYDNFITTLEKISHRGPDDDGIVLINTNTNDFRIIKRQASHVEGETDISAVTLENFNLIIGHKRLSIVDLSSCGHQPMWGIDGSWIAYNGEVYNYIELKEDLTLLGCRFNTHSDTEVILEAYRVWGKDCLSKFNGMWSIIIWDAPNRKIFISNDRFGVKPLYYHETVGGFCMISETKQLQAYKHLQLTLNREHIGEFANFGFVDHNDKTMYNEVYRFRKAHYAFINPADYGRNDLQKNQTQYYKLRRSAHPIGEIAAISEFRRLLYDSVRIRMRADVDFGFALSGGIDSSAILYTARNITKNEHLDNELLGFSAIFPGHDESDESRFVKIVAEDLPSKTVYCNAMEEFNVKAFEKHVYHQDEPLAGTTFFAQWSVYEKAAQTGIKILFNGQGADEVFGGYHHHFYRYCRQLLMLGKLPEYFSLVHQYSELKGILKKKIHRIVFNEIKLSAKMKLGIAKFDHALLKYWNKIDTLGEMLLGDFDTFQLPTYLRVDDRNSMAFSMESRHPFMDYRLVEFGYSLPDNLLINMGWQKYIIRKSMHEMPETIRYRKDKKGFTTPQQVWLDKYKEQFESYLGYNEKVLGVRSPSGNKYQNYALGAWFKVNNA